MLKNFIGGMLAACLLCACATSPSGRSQLILLPDDQVNRMGLQAFAQLKKTTPINHDDDANHFVQCVVRSITSEIGGKWEAVVFQDKSVNAFALPGGKIGVNTGLLMLVESQDQFAAVIGHEIAHVLARHSNERMSQETAAKLGLSLAQLAAPQTQLGQAALGMLGLGAEYGVLLPYSRLHESEADTMGLDLMAKAGFDPAASIKLWELMAQANQGQPPEFLSTHPSHTTRIRDLQSHLPHALQLQKQAQARGKTPHCG